MEDAALVSNSSRSLAPPANHLGAKREASAAPTAAATTSSSSTTAQSDTVLSNQLNGSLFSSEEEVIDAMNYPKHTKRNALKVLQMKDSDLNLMQQQSKSFWSMCVKSSVNNDTFDRDSERWSVESGRAMNKCFEGTDIRAQLGGPIVRVRKGKGRVVVNGGHYPTHLCANGAPDIVDGNGKVIGYGYDNKMFSLTAPNNPCVQKALQDIPDLYKINASRQVGIEDWIPGIDSSRMGFVDCTPFSATVPSSKLSRKERETFLEKQKVKTYVHIVDFFVCIQKLVY